MLKTVFNKLGHPYGNEMIWRIIWWRSLCNFWRNSIFQKQFFWEKSYFWSKWFNICANFVLPGVLVLLTSSDLQLFKFKISKLIQIPVMAHLDSWVNGRIPVGPRPARQQFLLEHTCILTFGTFSKSGSFFNHSAHFSSIMS